MKETVYQTIRERILFLIYKPGQILNEKVIAEEFGLSRSPVKDVLNRLEWDELVRVIPRTGSMVTEIEFSRIMNIYQVRFELEAFEGSLAQGQFQAKHIDRLKSLCDDANELIDHEDRRALATIDINLRQIFHIAAGNPVLAQVSDRLYTQTFRLWYSVLDKCDWREEVLAVIKDLNTLGTFLTSNKDPEELGKLRKQQLATHFDRLRQKFLGGQPF